MKLYTKPLFSLFAVFWLAGCTTYLYQGKITAPDSANIDREVIIAWSVTDPLIGKEKADLIALRTACGVPIQFDEKENGIYFFGTPGKDIPISGAPVNEPDLVCGQILQYMKVEDITEGRLQLTIICRPKPGRFTGDTRQYLKAQQAPYEFMISRTKSWSLFGEDIQLPIPDCTQ